MGGATALVVGSQVKPRGWRWFLCACARPGRAHGESESIPPRTDDKSKSYSQLIAVSSQVHKMRRGRIEGGSAPMRLGKLHVQQIDCRYCVGASRDYFRTERCAFNLYSFGLTPVGQPVFRFMPMV